MGKFVFRCGSMLVLTLVSWGSYGQDSSGSFESKVQQLNFSKDHHFSGYIGQCQTIPWNASGRYIVELKVKVIDRLPDPKEAAKIILVDTHDDNKIVEMDRTHAWNPQ